MEEHYGLGERFESKYPELLGVGGYDPAKTTFQNTKKERTAASATAFAAGLYNQLGPLPNKASSVYSFNLPYDKDPTLRPFDMCPAYDNAVHQDPHQSPLFHEHFTYLNAHLPSITSRISSLIYGNITGPGGSIPLSASTVSTMYDVCTLEYAVFNESQQFCTLFTNEDFLMFEYAADLEEYWSRSFGFPLAYQIGAPLLSEMINTFNAKFNVLQQIDHEARRSEMAPDATTLTSFFRFAHAETMEPILTILGLYNDSSPLRADWTPQQIQNRKFKSSWLFPFASNLALLGYDCANAPSMPERFYIKAQHNERDVTLPACEKDKSLFCGFNTFKTYYSSLASVQLSQICGTVPHANPVPTPTVLGDVNTPKFQPIYVWGPITLVALAFVSLTVGYCVGVHSPSRRIVSEPLLSSERD
jgi:multiple inositol-polyphosphate phosphatase/2,3-bisphosphoglycerate 3-phosphatase